MSKTPTFTACACPWRIVLASIAGLWLCYFLLTTLRGWAIGFDAGLAAGFPPGCW